MQLTDYLIYCEDYEQRVSLFQCMELQQEKHTCVMDMHCGF